VPRARRLILGAAAPPAAAHGDVARHHCEDTRERRALPAFVLALQRRLSRAHRPQPQGPALRHRTGAPGARRRRAARAGVRGDQPAATGARTPARPPHAAAVAVDPGIPRRDVARAAAAAGDRARPPARARAGAGGRLRHPPAQQPARAAVPGKRLGRAAARARRLDQALDRRGLRRVRGIAPAPSLDRRVLRWAPADHRRRLPGAAGLQRAAIRRGHVALPHDRAHRGRMPGIACVRRRPPGAAAGRAAPRGAPARVSAASSRRRRPRRGRARRCRPRTGGT
jgi:hypothetical protein